MAKSSIFDTFETSRAPQTSVNVRPDMKGPSGDISEILAGLKTRTIQVEKQQQQQQQHEQHQPVFVNSNNNSTISLSDTKDLFSNGEPQKSRRRNRSDKNSVSLDI
jgi:multidrug efflux pump subunit AcrB